MADYFGKLIVEPHTLEHQSGHFKAAIAQIRRVQQQHGIGDTIVVAERYKIHPPGGLRFQPPPPT